MSPCSPSLRGLANSLNAYKVSRHLAHGMTKAARPSLGREVRLRYLAEGRRALERTHLCRTRSGAYVQVQHDACTPTTALGLGPRPHPGGHRLARRHPGRLPCPFARRGRGRARPLHQCRGTQGAGNRGPGCCGRGPAQAWRPSAPLHACSRDSRGLRPRSRLQVLRDPQLGRPRRDLHRGHPRPRLPGDRAPGRDPPRLTSS